MYHIIVSYKWTYYPTKDHHRSKHDQTIKDIIYNFANRCPRKDPLLVFKYNHV